MAAARIFRKADDAAGNLAAMFRSDSDTVPRCAVGCVVAGDDRNGEAATLSIAEAAEARRRRRPDSR
jgi:hypothetical protein